MPVLHPHPQSTPPTPWTYRLGWARRHINLRLSMPPDILGYLNFLSQSLASNTNPPFVFLDPTRPLVPTPAHILVPPFPKEKKHTLTGDVTNAARLDPQINP